MWSGELSSPPGQLLAKTMLGAVGEAQRGVFPGKADADTPRVRAAVWRVRLP